MAFHRNAGWLAGVAGLAIATAAAVQPVTAAPAQTLGYAVTYFWYDFHESNEDCPDGFTPGRREFLLLGLPEREQARLKRPENREEFEKVVVQLAKKAGFSIGSSRNGNCQNPENYIGTDPLPMKTVTGPHAFGMDLDGGSKGATCPHAEFTTPAGARGIDNQLYRVIGCMAGYRRDSGWGAGTVEDYAQGTRRDGQMAILIEVTGVDDRQNDPDVDVGIYSSPDPTSFYKDTGPDGGGGLPYTSMTVTEQPRYQNRVKGRIENGVLITDTVDLRLKFAWATMLTEYWIRDARLRLPLTPVDARSEMVEGQLGGYYDLRAFWSTFMGNTTGAMEGSCPSVWEKLHEMADGFPDPANGQCTALSTAFKVRAVPAFVVHPEEARGSAAAAPRQTAGIGAEAQK